MRGVPLVRTRAAACAARTSYSDAGVSSTLAPRVERDADGERGVTAAARASQRSAAWDAMGGRRRAAAAI
jgi:hypothetical protein